MEENNNDMSFDGLFDAEALDGLEEASTEVNTVEVAPEPIEVETVKEVVTDPVKNEKTVSEEQGMDFVKQLASALMDKKEESNKDTKRSLTAQKTRESKKFLRTAPEKQSAYYKTQPYTYLSVSPSDPLIPKAKKSSHQKDVNVWSTSINFVNFIIKANGAPNLVPVEIATIYRIQSAHKLEGENRTEALKTINAELKRGTLFPVNALYDFEGKPWATSEHNPNRVVAE